MTKERSGIVTIHGSPLTLLGPEISVGDQAPPFTLIDNDLKPVTLDDSKGRVRLITVVPSLDTPVCDTMARRFNEEVADLSDELVVYTVSVDLPFAQKRWCGAAGIDKIQTLSDYQERSFGCDYGLLTKELKILARAVLVINRAGKIVYYELVKEVTDEPDYAAALKAVKELL